MKKQKRASHLNCRKLGSSARKLEASPFSETHQATAGEKHTRIPIDALVELHYPNKFLGESQSSGEILDANMDFRKYGH